MGARHRRDAASRGDTAKALLVSPRPAPPLAAALAAQGCEPTALPLEQREGLYADCLQQARALAERLGEPEAGTGSRHAVEFGELQFFNL